MFIIWENKNHLSVNEDDEGNMFVNERKNAIILINVIRHID